MCEKVRQHRKSVCSLNHAQREGTLIARDATERGGQIRLLVFSRIDSANLQFFECPLSSSSMVDLPMVDSQ